MSERLILASIGNTSVTAALAEGGRIIHRIRVPSVIRDRIVIGKVLRMLCRGGVVGSVVCSVVPAAGRIWMAELKRAGCRRVLETNCRLELGVKFEYPHPETLGADRLANICAVASSRQVAVIADFGTATAFNVLRGGAFIGGAIAPGWPLVESYLHEKTALLPKISFKGRLDPVGKSTSGSMQLGCVAGYRGMIAAITDRLAKAAGGKCAFIATGGHARTVLNGSGLPFKIDPDLTLKGLMRISELNPA